MEVHGRVDEGARGTRESIIGVVEKVNERQRIGAAVDVAASQLLRSGYCSCRFCTFSLIGKIYCGYGQLPPTPQTYACRLIANIIKGELMGV